MKKRVYYVWISLVLLVTLYCGINFIPQYEESLHPLFEDILMLLFLPSTFIFAWILIHLVSKNMTGMKVKIFNSLILLLATSYVIYVLDVHAITKAILILVGLLVGFAFYMLNNVIYKALVK